MQNLTVAIVQSDLLWENSEANLLQFDKKLEQIAPGTDLVVLPEMFNTGFSIKSDECAQTMEGTAFNWMKQKAAVLNMVISGSIFTRVGGQVYNRLLWVQPDGEFIAYDKRHLFRFAGEHNILTFGKERMIVELKGWKIMPLICYDLRFPVWSKNRFIEGRYEYDLLVYVANWPNQRQYAWKQLLIARAIENQAYCIGVNRVGSDGYGYQHSGDSIILNPQGQIMKQCEPFNEEMITINLDYNELSDYRKVFPVGMDWDDFEVKNYFVNNT